VKVIWSPLALDRVSEAAEYIARDDPLAAEEWLSGILDAAERLSNFPRRGRLVPEAGRQDVREIYFGNYRIIYRIEPNRIAILTVRHLRRLVDKEELKSQQKGPA
jgi:plasmid stabilization system protein ParE